MHHIDAGAAVRDAITYYEKHIYMIYISAYLAHIYIYIHIHDYTRVCMYPCKYFYMQTCSYIIRQPGSHELFLQEALRYPQLRGFPNMWDPKFSWACQQC